MNKLVIAAIAVLCLAASALPITAQSPDGAVIKTQLTLLTGFPAEKAGDEISGGVLIVPGMVIPLDAGPGPKLQRMAEQEEHRVMEQLRLADRLKETLRLAEVRHEDTRELPFAVGTVRHLPAGSSDVKIQVELLGFNQRTATFRVRFTDGGQDLADTPVSITLGERAVVGGLDGPAAPYLFLVLEPARLPVLRTPGGPILIGDGVTPPRALERTMPQYTPEAKESRLQGIVIVQVLIDEEGRIQEAKVLKGLPLGLEEAALTAVRQWRFQPATKDGKPVAVYYNLTINFRLEEEMRKEQEGGS